MLNSTFCHLAEITTEEEKQLWRQGICTWDDLLCYAAVYWKKERYYKLNEGVKHSNLAIQTGDINFFLNSLPEIEAYRIYPVFSDKLTFLDIETTGLEADALISVVSLLNCRKMRTYINSINLENAFDNLVNKFTTVVTFNGTKFDLPRLRKKFRHFNPGHHIDLAKIFKAYGLKGKLKTIANNFGCKNDTFSGGEPSSGAEAAEAWYMFKATGDRSKLTGLIRYNQWDVILLEKLLRLFCMRQSKRYSLPYEQ